MNLFRYFQIREIQRELKLLRRIIERNGVDKRVNWQAAAIAGCARNYWRRVTNTEPPSTIHADAPGPFGRFLQDVLDELFSTLEPSKAAPSARSAMRALQNVTSSGGKYLEKW